MDGDAADGIDAIFNVRARSGSPSKPMFGRKGSRHVNASAEQGVYQMHAIHHGRVVANNADRPAFKQGQVRLHAGVARRNLRWCLRGRGNGRTRKTHAQRECQGYEKTQVLHGPKVRPARAPRKPRPLTLRRMRRNRFSSPTRFIASRLAVDPTGKGMARPVVRIATGGVAVGIAMIILSWSVVRGFQQEVQELVVGFGSHVRVVAPEQGRAQQTAPFEASAIDTARILAIPGVRHIQQFGQIPGILQVDDQVKGVVFKGFGADFDREFFGRRVVEGRLPNFGSTTTAAATSTSAAPNNDLLIGATTAGKLGLALDQKIRIYLADRRGGVRPRVFKICGLYATGLQEFDASFVFGDLQQVADLSGWDSTQTGGYEILLDDYDSIWAAQDSIFFNVPFGLDVQSITEQHPELFNWLSMLDMNVELIIALMVFIAIINLASAMLIIMLERARSIGLLKAIGMTDRPLITIFIRLAGRIFMQGMLWGNAVGLGLALLQRETGWVKLDASSYYLSEVPMLIQWRQLLAIEAAVLLVCVLVMALPAMYVARIDPVRALKFD